MAHDFNLHAPEGANKRRRILGRGQGSGRGSTAGKGGRGQKARSGSSVPYVGFEGGQMPLYRRLAHRGFSNYPFKKSFQIVNIGEINKRFNDGETVDEVSLYDKRLIKGRKKGEAFKAVSPVKILGNGDLTKKLIVKIGAGNGVGTSGGGITVSGSAKEKIQKAGGELVANAEKSAAEGSAQ